MQTDPENIGERRRTDESSAERDLKPDGENAGEADHVVIRKTRKGCLHELPGSPERSKRRLEEGERIDSNQSGSFVCR